MSLTSKSATELAALQKTGQVSAVEVTRAFLDQIQQHDSRIKAFLEVDEAGALESAGEVDRQRQAGQPLGPLAGIPIAIKDNLCVKGWKASCASKMLASFRPPYDAHVITQLRNAGAVFVGRANMDEFAMGSSTETSAFQLTANPWKAGYTPGGSSGGSAAAVAARMAPLSLGSDTGGSVRQPASFCGIVGLKPSYGRISRYGLIAFASSLDQIGTLGTNVTDTALLLQAIAGHDARDSTSVDTAVPDILSNLEQPLQGLKIGIVPEHFGDGLQTDVAQAIQTALDVYRSLGATVSEISLPHSRYGVAAYYVIAPSEASSNLARYDGIHYGHRSEKYQGLVDLYETSRGEGFGDEVKRRIMIGTYALSSGYYDAYYVKALKVRRKIANDFTDAFRSVDIIVTPTAPATAFPLQEEQKSPIKRYMSDLYTTTANLAGLPGISIPCGLGQDGLPIGMQLLAPAFEEDRLLRAARMYERETTPLPSPLG